MTTKKDAARQRAPHPRGTAGSPRSPQPESAALLIAERLVREHDLRCAGELDADVPHCSCAPNDQPLCRQCAEHAYRIAVAITDARAEGRAEAALAVKAPAKNEGDHECIDWNSGGACYICRRPLSIAEQTRNDPPVAGDAPAKGTTVDAVDAGPRAPKDPA